MKMIWGYDRKKQQQWYHIDEDLFIDKFESYHSASLHFSTKKFIPHFNFVIYINIYTFRSLAIVYFLLLTRENFLRTKIQNNMQKLYYPPLDEFDWWIGKKGFVFTKIKFLIFLLIEI